MTENNLPLSGIKVIELASIVASPTTGRLLSDYGAEVIKVEAPSGDALRVLGELNWLPIDDDNNPLFDNFNSGKKLISINLKTPEGIDCLIKLLSNADVFITNVRMMSLEKMHLDYESLKEKFPRLIYAHFSGFGLKGPDKNRPGYDSTAFWMRTGAAVDMVQDGSLPARPSYAFGDIATASYFLNGILIALMGRQKTGKGTLVETSLLNSGIWMCSPYVINTQPQYGNPLPYNRYEPWSPFADYFKCKDDVWISPLTKGYNVEREYLSKLFGLPEMINDPDYENIDKMKRSGKEHLLMHHIEEIISQKTSLEWKEIFEKADLPYEIGYHIKDVSKDQQAIENGYFTKVNYPEGTSLMPNPPIKLSEYSPKDFKKSGPVGTDTDNVLAEYGYSPKEIEDLKKIGAII